MELVRYTGYVMKSSFGDEIWGVVRQVGEVWFGLVWFGFIPYQPLQVI